MLLEMSLPFFYFVWARFMKTLVFVRAISYASLDTASTEFNYKINSRTVKIKVRSTYHVCTKSLYISRAMSYFYETEF